MTAVQSRLRMDVNPQAPIMIPITPCSLPVQGWPLEATTGNDPHLPEDSFLGHGLCVKEALQESFVFSSQFQLHNGREPNWCNPTSDESSPMKRKLSHNAYERDRRKKMNTLYFSLRSLLPEMEYHKKLSIPSTVSRVLQYIPELQRQVERLESRKEEILARLSREGEDNARPGDDGGRGVYPVISVVELGDGEITIQIYSSCRRTRTPLSKILEYLEGESLQVISASFLAKDESKTLYSFHLQVKDVFLEPGALSKNLSCILSQEGDGSIANCHQFVS